MPTDSAFAHFLRRIRAGDQQAAVELVRQYEPAIRREVRMRLTDPGLYRLLDSVDICQSVLASFFVRAATGQYELDGPEDLLRLLKHIARNKLVSHTRKLRRQCRDMRRTAPAGPDQLKAVMDAHPSPSEVVSGQDLLREVLQSFTDEERQIADLRGQECSWPEIATRLGGKSEARRKQFARAVDRVIKHLRLEEDG